MYIFGLDAGSIKAFFSSAVSIFFIRFYLRILSILCTAKMRKKLMESAPWRGEEKSDKFEGAKLRATNQPGGTATMYVPAKKSVNSKADDGEDSIEIDPELRYSFQRNAQEDLFFIAEMVK
ncbi:hypothetical protein ACLOJK_014215 [Asimina triloba]